MRRPLFLIATLVLAGCDLIEGAVSSPVCPAVVTSVSVEVRTATGEAVGDAALAVQDAGTGRSVLCPAGTTDPRSRDCLSPEVVETLYAVPRLVYLLMSGSGRWFGRREGTKRLRVTATRGASRAATELVVGWDVCGVDLRSGSNVLTLAP